MDTAITTFGAEPPLRLQEVCGAIVRQLRTLGYAHADYTTCERMLRAFFPHTPKLVEGSEDLAAGTAFLERFMSECHRREQEMSSRPRARRCYGQVVEQAVTEAEGRGDASIRAPRLTELMLQLDADGHNTNQLRLELEGLIDALGVTQHYR